jgi:predicted flavoprotein YhiN
MKTMQSKVCPGLYVCGELINVDGVTGGYNFMNCWGTGYVAGTSAATPVLDVEQQTASQ